MEIRKWQQFWLWTVLWEEIKKVNPSWWVSQLEKCKCECWLEKYVKKEHLINWHSKGCHRCACKKRRERDRIRDDKRFYWIYYAIRTRCYNKKTIDYKRYWAKWIKCEWNCYKEFYNDMHDSYKEHCKLYWEKDTTIDRIDRNWNYCKENCRWATYKEQADNKKTTIKVVDNWITYNSLKDFCINKWYTYTTWLKKTKEIWTKNLII